jgi:hypothetical protein
MSITTTNEPRNLGMRVNKTPTSRHGVVEIDIELPLTVPAMVKTMLEIIKVKKFHSMDEETKKQFPVFAKEILLLAEQTQ